MFDEIGKDIDALFGGYEFSHTLRCSSTNSDIGLSMTGEGTLSNNGSVPASSISMARKTNGGAFTIDNLSITDEGRISGEFTMKAGAASKLYLCAQDERSEPGRSIKSSGKIGAEYRTDLCCIDTSVDVVNGPTGSSTFLYKYVPWNIQFGANLQVNSHWDDVKSRGKKDKSERSLPVEIEDINFCLAYVTPSYQIHAKTADYVNTMSVGYLQQLSPKLLFGALVDYSFNVNSQNLAIGASYKFDEKLQVKAKVSSSAQLAGQMKHQINDSVHINLSTGVDMRDSMVPAKFGIGLVFDFKS